MQAVIFDTEKWAYHFELAAELQCNYRDYLFYFGTESEVQKFIDKLNAFDVLEAAQTLSPYYGGKFEDYLEANDMCPGDIVGDMRPEPDGNPTLNEIFLQLH